MRAAMRQEIINILVDVAESKSWEEYRDRRMIDPTSLPCWTSPRRHRD